jgi:hypothetical protein
MTEHNFDLLSTGEININPFDSTSFEGVYIAYYFDFLGNQKSVYSDSFLQKFQEFYNTTRLDSSCSMVIALFDYF